MSKTVTTYSMEEIEKACREISDSKDQEIWKALDRIRQRINDLEQVIRIYEGHLGVAKNEH